MSRSGCAAIADELSGIGISGSVLNDADVEKAVATALTSFGRFDAAVFGAGRRSEMMKEFDVPTAPSASWECFPYHPACERDIFDIPWKAWQVGYDMMVLAPMRLAKAVASYMIKQRSGSFVAISGIEAAQLRLPFPLGPTRLALQGFIKLLADRHGRDGLRFDSVSPGLMESAETEFHPAWRDQVPIGRVGKNREVVETIAFLLSDAAGYITGQCLTVDGGVNRPLGL